MQWNELIAFVAVAEQKSFSKAAEIINLTQPAVSKRVRTLEDDVGVKLFDRVGRRVHLTDAGRVLLPRARALLLNVEDTRRLLQNTHNAVEGQMRMATSHHVGLHHLAPVLRVFARRFAGVKLDIRFEDSEAALDMVRRAETELAVVTLDPQGPNGLHYRTLWDDPLVFVVADTHPLAGRDAVMLTELSTSPSILPGLATFTGRIVRDRFVTAGLNIQPEMSTNYLETIAMLVGIGLGWSVLPGTLVGDGLTVLDVQTPPMTRTLGCVTNPDRTLSNAAQAFIDVIEEFAGNLGSGPTASSGP